MRKEEEENLNTIQIPLLSLPKKNPSNIVDLKLAYIWK
jgi:hypothetical protein